MQVLFPLLDKVAIESGLASTEKSGDSLLIHHSRNTEQKQWSETQASFTSVTQLRSRVTWLPQVLTISGVARVFVTKRSLLHTLGDFPKAWRLLLEHIEKLSLSATQEVFDKVICHLSEPVCSGLSGSPESLSRDGCVRGGEGRGARR